MMLIVFVLISHLLDSFKYDLRNINRNFLIPFIQYMYTEARQLF